MVRFGESRIKRLYIVQHRDPFWQTDWRNQAQIAFPLGRIDVAPMNLDPQKEFLALRRKK